MKKEEKKDILENIRWFKKFSLEKRLRVSAAQRKTIEVLRNLIIEGYAKPRRND